MKTKKSKEERKKRDIGEDGFCRHFFEDIEEHEKIYRENGEGFLILSGLFRSYLKCNPGLFDDSSGMVPVPKWALKIVAEAFEKHYQKKEVEHDLNVTLDDVFGISGENKQETMRKLYARNKEIYFRWLNRVRMYFGLNIKDAATATGKIVEWYKNDYPGMFFNFNASKETMLDAYYRAYPQHEFIQWVAKESKSEQSFEQLRDHWQAWLEKRVPEAATYIKRKMK